MGIRFRKRISILPWLKLNISKSGLSTTIGPKGFNVNVGSKGSFLNTGIPGTGFYSRNKIAGTRSYTNHSKNSRNIGCSGTVIRYIAGFIFFSTLINVLFNIREQGLGKTSIDVFANIGTIFVLLTILYFIFRKKINSLFSNDEDDISIDDYTYQDTTQSNIVQNNTASPKSQPMNNNIRRAKFLLSESSDPYKKEILKWYIDCHVDKWSHPLKSIPHLSGLSEDLKSSYKELCASFNLLSKSEHIWNPARIKSLFEVKNYTISEFYDNISFYNIYCAKRFGGSWKQTEVDKFWEHRNKDGQKDYRYKNNKELSIVRYIALEIASHIIIFDDVNAALDFNRKLSNLLCLQGISIPELV